MPGELSTGEEVLAAALLVLQLAAVGATAVVATTRLVGRDGLARALAFVLLVLAQIAAVPMVLGMVGLLRLPAVVVAHLAVAAAAAWWHRRAGATSDGRTGPGRWGWPAVAAVAAAAAYLVLGTGLSLHPQRSTEFDTKEYHLANLASWVQEGDLWTLPYAQPGSMTANHPSTGEVVGVWLALPTHGDELVYLVPVAFGLVAILAGALLGRELVQRDDGAALGALATVAVLTAPIYFGQVDSLLTDIVTAAATLAAVALLVLARRAPAGRAELVGLAGVALGFGMGSKYTGLLPGLVVGLVAIFLLRRSRDWWWLLPGILVLAVPWYLRNLVTTGNPLFPQAIGPIDGADSPYRALEASLLDHVRDGATGPLRRAASLAREVVGPVLVVVAMGVLLPFLRRPAVPDRAAVRWVGALGLAGIGLYLATPYTGGGPTGLDFIIASCFRYAMAGVLLAAVAGAVLAGRIAGTAVVAAVLTWNLWEIGRNVDLDRPQLRVSPTLLVAAVAIALVSAALTQVDAGGLRDRLVRRRASAAALAAVVLVAGAGAVAGATLAYRRLDRGRSPTDLEQLLLALGEERPAIPLGVADLRAVLGPRLERPLVKVSRGGAADEIPFADEAQLRRRILGEDTAPPPPHLAAELDRALDEADADILVTAPISPVGYPDGWRPAQGWCLVGGDGEGTVFVRPTLLPAGAACVRAPEG